MMPGKKLLLLLTLLALPAYANPGRGGDDFTVGVQLYQQGKFQLAISYLNAAARGAYSGSAAAHYYLANALVQTNRVSAALNEYREVLRLDPNGQYGKNAQLVLKKQEGTRTGGTAVATEAETFTEKLDINMEAGVVNKLPKLPVFAPESVQPSVIFLWTPADLAAYVQKAQDRLDRAKRNVEEAQNVLRRAESLSYSLLPSVKAFGESEEHLNVRRIKARRKIDELLVPYHKAVEERERLLAEENKLFDRCIVCYRNIYGVQPIFIH